MRQLKENLERLVLSAVSPWWLSLWRLKYLRQGALSLEDYLSIAFTFGLRSVRIKPLQIQSEALEFLRLLDEAQPKAILEIGTARGGMLYLFSRVASPRALLISIDLPDGLFGGGYPASKSRLYRSFARHGQRIVLVRGDSHQAASLESIRSVLPRDGLDCLFIDGDHRYDGVKLDFEMYSPLVKPGGVIAFHDIVPGERSRVGGVPDFWKEVKSGSRHREIVEDWAQPGFGIGVLWV